MLTRTKFIISVIWIPAAVEETGYDIYLMNYATKETKRLTDSPKTEPAPVIVTIRSNQ